MSQPIKKSIFEGMVLKAHGRIEDYAGVATLSGDWYVVDTLSEQYRSLIDTLAAAHPGKSKIKIEPANTLADKAAQLRITLDQYVTAAATCESCEHKREDKQTGVLCLKQGCSTCKQYVGFRSKCPINKWDNTKSSGQPVQANKSTQTPATGFAHTSTEWKANWAACENCHYFKKGPPATCTKDGKLCGVSVQFGACPIGEHPYTVSNAQVKAATMQKSAKKQVTTTIDTGMKMDNTTTFPGGIQTNVQMVPQGYSVDDRPMPKSTETKWFDALPDWPPHSKQPLGALDWSAYFGHTFVINLDCATERLTTFMENVPDGWGFPKIERLPAVDGGTQTVTEKWRAGRGAWGLYQTCKQLIERAITEGWDKPIILLEDDCRFVPDFMQRVSESLKNLPDDWELLWFGGQHYGGKKQPCAPGLIRAGNPHRTHSWAIHPRFFKQLLDIWEKHFGHIDHALTACGSKFKFFAVDPFLTGQAPGTSYIGKGVKELTTWDGRTKEMFKDAIERDRMRIPDMLQFFKGKTVAVVGNGPTANKYDHAAKIDACDIVVRFNQFRLGAGFENVGTKTDVICFPFGWAPAIPSMETMRACNPKWLIGCCPALGTTEWATVSKYESRNVGIIPVSIFGDIKSKIGHRPTSGLAFMAWLLKYTECASVYATGFSLENSGDHHYYPVNGFDYNIHNPVKEREVFKELMLSNRLSMDAESMEKVKTNIFTTWGKIGDILYALPYIQSIGGGELHFVRGPRSRYGPKDIKDRFETVLSYLPGVTKVAVSEKIESGISLDAFRSLGHRGLHRSLAQSHFIAAGLTPPDFKDAWMVCNDPKHVADVVISRSFRYPNKTFPWQSVLKQYYGRIVFVGLSDEHKEFVRAYGAVPHADTKTLRDLVQVIAGSKLFIGNQSAPLAIAIGLGKDTVVVADQTGTPDCLFKRDNITHWLDSGDIPTVEDIKMDGVTLITPTGDRHESFAMCERYMRRQTYTGPIQWIVIDDGEVPTICTAGQQYIRRERTDDKRHSLPAQLKEAIKHIKYNRLLIIEDDDYYYKEYVEQMRSYLDDANLVGIGDVVDYHVGVPGHNKRPVQGNASLAACGFRGDAIAYLENMLKDFKLRFSVDLEMWKRYPGSKKLVTGLERCSIIQIKGMHSKRMSQLNQHTNKSQYTLDATWLRNKIGRDADGYGQSVQSFHSRGNYGDVLCAIPFIQSMGGGTLYVTERESRQPKQVDDVDYSLSKRAYELSSLLVGNSCVVNVVPVVTPPNESVDVYDIGGTGWRSNPRIDLIRARFARNKKNVDESAVNSAWLGIPPRKVGRVVINRTARYHGKNFEWRKILERYKGDTIFLGTESEHQHFIDEFGPVPHVPTQTLLDAAQIIAGCDLFVGNQSALFCIAEGLKVARILEASSARPECFFNTPGFRTSLE